jgi:arylsulfatase A-like enzyme
MLLILALCACRPSPESPAADRRFIDEAPADELRVAQLSSLECVFAADFAGGQLGPGLTLADASPLATAGGHGLTLRGGDRAPRLRVARRFVAGEFDAVRLSIAGVRRGNVRLRWTVPGAPATAAPGAPATSGALELPKALGGGTMRDQFFFDLAGLLPHGQPIDLEIEPTTAAGEVVTITELCIGRARLDAERLAVATRIAWKATLGDEARDVLVQPAAGQLAKRLVLPKAARLTAGFGRLAGRAPAVRLRVSATPPGEPSLLLLDRVATAAELAAGWIDLGVDLSADLAGRKLPAGGEPVELTLAASPEQSDDPAFVGVWSAPRVSSAIAPSRRPNIVLISLDTLRADHLSLYGYGRETSPQLDAWVRERRGTVFRHVVPSSGWTLPSHFSLFTGLDAIRHPANYNTVAIDSSAFSFLAERLFAAGYRTQAFTGGGFVHPLYGLAKGFEGFAYWASKERRMEELESNLEEAGKWLDARAFSDGRSAGSPGGTGDPFLLFLHTYEAHTPNTARQPFFGRMSGLRDDLVVDVEPDADLVEKGFLGTGHAVTRTAIGKPGERLTAELANLPIDYYDSAIAYMDDRLAPFLHRLSEPPFGGDTIVVIFSDHGEALGEGGRAGHAHLALNNLQVPLIIVQPGSRPPREIPTQVRLHDLFPTLLELAGVPVPGGIDGQTLSPLLAGGSEPGGRPAWAYAASTNHGLSLLSPDGLKLDWRNSLWKPIAGDLLWFRQEGFKEIALAAAPATPEAERMVRQIQQVYAREANGLRFELRNLSPQPVRVAITSDLVDPASVKSPLVNGVRLDWGYIGYLEAGIDAGASLALQFERTQRREIELQVEVRMPACATAVVASGIATDVDHLRQPLRRLIDLPSCPDAPAAGGGLELFAAWQGPLPAAQGTQTDAALREDLRALGYLH